MKKYLLTILWILLIVTTASSQADEIMERVKHDFVDNNGVKIHYASIGEGPLIVMVHGFPDFWLSWHHQMKTLSDQFQVVAIDQRGYNLSDRPEGVENYAMPILASDVAAVVHDIGVEKAIIVGHDWGGAVSWTVAMMYPQMVDKLIICNLPHPNGINRELANNPEQQKNSQYARDFQKPDAHKVLTPDGLASWVKDENLKKHYEAAFRKSDFEAMLNYYKANYPQAPYSVNTTPLPKIQCPVLLIHGLDDWALLPGALNDTWEWVDSDLTLMTIPGAGHFVQHDAAELVSRSMKMWLNR